ncbi:hypothetical protein GCM10020367_18040 [Streptomyces sannanensis]|uniref:Uncharacterized protein n=1 Tax=Streptomyces sannanensis TaxID=285536 RepID=A0ABP6S8Y8_9ACTN
MSIDVGTQELIDRFCEADKDSKSAASEALVAAGAAVVAPLIAVLLDEDAPVEWHEPASLLREIGEPALRPLADAIAAAATDEAARRARWAFTGLRVTDLGAYIRTRGSGTTPRTRSNARGRPLSRTSPACFRSSPTRTRVHGHGLLALTPTGRTHGHPRGALRI